MTVLESTVAVRVVMPEVPPMFKTAPLPWVSPPPVPLKAVATVKVVLLVRVTPVTVTLGIEIAVVPPIAWLFVLKVYTPDPAVKVVPLWVIPPRNVTAKSPELFHVPPALIVTSPVKSCGIPIFIEKVSVPLFEVVPLTVRAYPAEVKVVPVPMSRAPIVIPTTVVVVAVPLKVRVPFTVVVVVVRVLAPLPLKVRW